MPDIISLMTAPKSKKQSGFTIIELVIVFVVVVILAALVVFSYNGVRSRERDAARQENIVSLQAELEIFYAENSRYPTLAQLNSQEWRSEHMPDFDSGLLRDPRWSSEGDCHQDGRAVLSAEPAKGCYAYAASAAGGEACGNGTPCAHYTLTATLETDEDYIKTSLN